MDVNARVTNPVPNLAQRGIGDAKPLDYRRAGSNDGISLAGKSVEFKRPAYAAKFSLVKFLFGGQSYKEQKATFQAERAAKHRDLLFLELAKDKPNLKVVRKHCYQLMGQEKGVNFKMGTQQDGSVSRDRADMAANVLKNIDAFKSIKRFGFSSDSILDLLRKGLMDQAAPQADLALIQTSLADVKGAPSDLDKLLDQLDTGRRDSTSADPQNVLTETAVDDLLAHLEDIRPVKPSDTPQQPKTPRDDLADIKNVLGGNTFDLDTDLDLLTKGSNTPAHAAKARPTGDGDLIKDDAGTNSKAKLRRADTPRPVQINKARLGRADE